MDKDISQTAQNSSTLSTIDSVLNSGDITLLREGEKEWYIIGTAHISQKSKELVENAIEELAPDCVCVELDDKRYESIKNPTRWESLDVKEIIRKKELGLLIVNLMLASFQRRLGGQTGVAPGSELLAACQKSEEKHIRVELVDRDVRITLQRAWRKTGFFRKTMLLGSVFGSLFDDSEVSEEQLENLRQQDMLSEMLNEMSESLPEAKKVLIDERDHFLAEKIRRSPGKRVVAVVGAGHVPGIKRTIENQEEVNIAAINEIPPSAPWGKIIGWGIPLLILASLGYIGWSKGAEAFGDNALYWILANGIPSAVGALLALAHPLTILTAFLAAPITSLSPVIGAGYVAAFVQAWLQPPSVEELKSVHDDFSKPLRWWKNRLLRIFLALILPALGSAIGTWVGGLRIFSNLS